MRLTYIGMFLLALAWNVPGMANGIRVSPKARWNIFKGHDRVPFNPEKLPAVGKLMFRVGSHSAGSCTGTLIGKRLVLTAAHCFEPTLSYNAEIQARGLESEVKPRHIFFLPGFVDGKLPDGAKPVPNVIGEGWMGDWSKDNASNHNDWAVLKLEETPTSERIRDFGSLPVSRQPLEVGTRLVAIGYSGDFQDGNTAGVDSHCHVRKVLKDGSFFHDCAIEHGASGGPLLAMSVDGVTVTADNEDSFRNVDASKIQYQIVGVITAEIKRRSGDSFGGFFGDNMPFFGDIFGGQSEGEASEEYSDQTPNIGNAATNFADQVGKAVASESGRSVAPLRRHSEDEDGFAPSRRGDDEDGGSWFEERRGDDSEGPYFFNLTKAR